MLKRVLLGTLLVGVIAILVAGAIIRTVDKTENVAEARGEGRGRSRVETGVYAEDQIGGGGFGQGGRNGQAAGVANVERQYPNYETVPADWAVYDGTVAETPETGGELVVVTVDGQELTVGTGPGYMEALGFTLQAGEQVRVQGYWEGEEFKAAQVTRLQDGETIALRDQLGRPAWAGAGRWAVEQQAVAGEIARGQGGFGGEGRTDAPGDGTGTGQAQVDEWLTLNGTVVAVDADALVVQTAAGEQVVVENRPWWFAQEQGFVASAGDQVSVVGFYEDGEFEVGQIENLTSGQRVQIREEGGRPMWAGRGRRGG
jgi:hypothetical protein